VPAGSVLALWQEEKTPEARPALAAQVQNLLTRGPGPDAVEADRVLYRQLTSLSGPLLAHDPPPSEPGIDAAAAKANGSEAWGLSPELFGRHPDGSAVEESSLCLQAPFQMEVKLPADLVAGMEWVSAAVLHPGTGAEGSVQVEVTDRPGQIRTGLSAETPVLVQAGSLAEARMMRAFADFRQWFPVIVCYPRIVPVDEVITLTLFHREDEALRRLMLDEADAARLDRLWDELRYVSRDALATVDAFAQLMEYATQDSDPGLFEPLRDTIDERASALRQRLADTQPRHVEALLDFAGRAYRRPLTAEESSQIVRLYETLRSEEMPHEDAVRMTLARVLVAPAFLYKMETPGDGTDPSPVSDWELATRLSYFLWSSVPDEPLRTEAASGRLREKGVLVAQARRMLGDEKVRRLAVEFACQWLHIHGFDELDEKSERHFPEFKAMRGVIYEESIRFFTDWFARDGSILELLDADHAFVNGALAGYYGIPDVAGEEWRRVEGVKAYGRGGILGLGTTLAKQSGASRTSPILRGNWVYEVLLGERLPRPPPGVPQLPDDESALEGLTVRQMVEKHSSDPQCVRCHQHIDHFGYALEQYDAVGRRRDRDLGGRPIDTRVQTREGESFENLDGLRRYLLNERREVFVGQFCRKLLGYALGREVMLADQPLLEDMLKALEREEYRVGAAMEKIVTSRQFGEIRGRGYETTESQ
jgi:hypothetical protein